MGNEKWETGKWGNGDCNAPSTTVQVVSCEAGQRYILCKAAQVLDRSGRSIVYSQTLLVRKAREINQ